MTAVRRFDHIGITVADLDRATTFFRALGLEADDPADVEGPFLDTVTGLSGAATRIVMLRVPGADTTVELSSFVRPDAQIGTTDAPANELGLRSVAFEVEDLSDAIERVAALGYGLVGGVGEWERAIAMAYVRGPEGIIVALAERLG